MLFGRWSAMWRLSAWEAISPVSQNLAIVRAAVQCVSSLEFIRVIISIGLLYVVSSVESGLTAALTKRVGEPPQRENRRSASSATA